MKKSYAGVFIVKETEVSVDYTAQFVFSDNNGTLHFEYSGTTIEDLVEEISADLHSKTQLLSKGKKTIKIYPLEYRLSAGRHTAQRPFNKDENELLYETLKNSKIKFRVKL